MKFEDFRFSQGNDLKASPVEQPSFKITFVGETAKSLPLSPALLPPEVRQALDNLAASVLDTENNQTLLMGYEKTGKSFLLEQLVANSAYYTDKTTMGTVYFVSLTDVDMIELENTHNLKKIVTKLKETFGVPDGNICFVTTSAEIGLYVANVLPLCRVILKQDTPEADHFQGPLSPALARVWQTWKRFDTINSFLVSREAMVDLLWVSAAARLNATYGFQLTKKQVATFVDYCVKQMPAIEEERGERQVLIVPPGVWATVLSRLVSNIVFTSDESFITPTGAVSFSKSLRHTFGEMAHLFGDLDPERQEEDEPTGPGAGLAQDFINLMEAAGVSTTVMMAGGPPPAAKEVPVTPLEFKKTEGLAARLKNGIMGQDEAIDRVADSLMVPAAGLHDPAKPLRSFLLLGPTGVGKTQLALDLAKEVAKRELPVIRIDMSEYQMPHEVAKLFGAPPGYVGSDHGGVLTNAVLENPQSIVLLDEIEKADAKVWDPFLQVLDSGRMTDSSGQVVDFTQTIIILTSNIGASEAARRKAGFTSAPGPSSNTDRVRDGRSIVMKELEHVARPEFLNRLDDILVFQPLTEEVASKIALRELKIVATRLRDKGYELKFTPAEVARLVVEEADISRYGAREIQRIVFRTVSAPVAKFIVKNSKKKTVTLSTASSSLVIA